MTLELALAQVPMVVAYKVEPLVRPLKVLNRSGRWTIPSHYDYPADAGDRLAQTAAAIIALRKGDVASDSAADHEPSAVIDPLDMGRPGVAGRGTRVTIRGDNERELADVVRGWNLRTRSSSDSFGRITFRSSAT